MKDIKIIILLNSTIMNKKSKLKPFKRYASCYINTYIYDVIGLTKYAEEKYIIRILNHEIMHIVLCDIGEEKASKKYDRLDNKMEEWCE